MCGIAGVYRLDGAPADGTPVRAMCDFLRHRGPDDAGLWVSGPVALGHRRLSIIDLSTRGCNPMPNEDGSVWLVFNGEIYNFRELRAHLETLGHRFRSQTDSEVVVHLYEERGPACVTELNGMFAFALWDDRARRLLLARDRYGVKPLYYTRVGETLAFASEVKAFLALESFRARPDPRALAEHFTFQNTLGDRTFFDGVALLPAGHTRVYQEGRVTDSKYWDLQFEPDEGMTLEDAGAGLRERFEAAVARQLVSDVPLGTYLSGGMDTGSISAVAARHLPGLHTFTCGFDLPAEASELEDFFDERDASHQLAQRLGTTHHALRLGPDALARALPYLVWALDEPRVGISYPTYHTAALIAQHVTVVLSGVGGDELFAGYPWRYEPALALRGGTFEEGYYRLWVRFFADEDKREFFTPEIARTLSTFSTFDGFREVLKGSRADDPLHRALYFDFKVFLHGLLMVEDKLSMAHGVEARVPFLDNDLVEYVRRIPSRLKFASGQGKVVLRHAMRGLLPEEILSRRKQGFTPPDRTWYKGPSLAYVQDLILGPRALARGYFEPAALRRILDDHLADRRDHRFLLWSLMCFEWWNRLFVDREPLPQPVAGERAGAVA